MDFKEFLLYAGIVVFVVGVFYFLSFKPELEAVQTEKLFSQNLASDSDQRFYNEEELTRVNTSRYFENASLEANTQRYYEDELFDKNALYNNYYTTNTTVTSTQNHDELNNLSWGLAGHTFDVNLNLTGFYLEDARGIDVRGLGNDLISANTSGGFGSMFLVDSLANIWGRGLRILENDFIPEFYTYFNGANQTEDIFYTLPASQGDENTFLKNNGAGVLTWEEVESGGIIGGFDGNVYSIGIINPDNNAVLIDLNIGGHSINNGVSSRTYFDENGTFVVEA